MFIYMMYDIYNLYIYIYTYIYDIYIYYTYIIYIISIQTFNLGTQIECTNNHLNNIKISLDESLENLP